MATSSKSACPPPAGMMRDRLVEQAISKFMPVVQAANGSEDVSVSADDFAVILGLLKATLPNQASAVEAAYERAIQDAERSHRRNRSKSWVLSCLRDRLRAEIASLSPVATSGSGLPSCVACEDDPKEPNNPCAVCGKCTKPMSGSEAGGEPVAAVDEAITRIDAALASPASGATVANGERKPGFYWVKGSDDWEPAEWTAKGWTPFRSISTSWFTDEDMGEIGPAIVMHPAPSETRAKEG